MTIQPAGPTPARTDKSESRYDRGTIILHWLTAGLVVALFLLAEGWGFFPRDIRKVAQALHISLGILLAAVLVARLLWRGTDGRRLPPATTGLQHWAAKAAHFALYGLLVVQVALGFLFRWAQDESFLLLRPVLDPLAYRLRAGTAQSFGGCTTPSPGRSSPWPGCMPAAALVHHHVLRDGVLRRMLPGRP